MLTPGDPWIPQKSEAIVAATETFRNANDTLAAINATMAAADSTLNAANGGISLLETEYISDAASEAVAAAAAGIADGSIEVPVATTAEEVNALIEG